MVCRLFQKQETFTFKDNRGLEKPDLTKLKRMRNRGSMIEIIQRANFGHPQDLTLKCSVAVT